MAMEEESWSDFLLTSYVKPEDDKWPAQIVPPGSRMMNHLPPMGLDHHPPPLTRSTVEHHLSSAAHPIMPMSQLPNIPNNHMYEMQQAWKHIVPTANGLNHAAFPNEISYPMMPPQMPNMIDPRNRYDEFIPLDALPMYNHSRHYNPQQHQPGIETLRDNTHTGLLQRIRNDAERVRLDNPVRVKQEKPNITPDELMAMAKVYMDGMMYYQSRMAQNRLHQEPEAKIRKRTPRDNGDVLVIEPTDDHKCNDVSLEPHTKDPCEQLITSKQPVLPYNISSTVTNEEIHRLNSGDTKLSHIGTKDTDSDASHDSIHSPGRRRIHSHTIHHYPTPADIAYTKQAVDLSDDSEHSLTDLITNLGRVASFMRATLECTAPLNIINTQKAQKPVKSPTKRASKDPRQDILKQAYKRHHKTCMNAIIKKQAPAVIRTCKPRRYDLSCFLQKSRFQTKRGKKMNNIRVMNFSDLKKKRRSDTESLWKLLKSSKPESIQD